MDWRGDPLLRRPVLLALSAVAVWWTWQFLTVHYNYQGNWTGLFCIRPSMPRPGVVKTEKLFLFENSVGYDGQVFHLIAHDPWMRKGTREEMIGAAFRYQRIFVPALAWTLALGQDEWVHAAYFAVILGFVFLGVYWTSMFAERAGKPAWWGLVFALTPAAITSIDRMTSDVALAGLTAGFAVYCAKLDWRMVTILTCAALTRETALPIIAGYAVYLATQNRRRDAVLAGLTAAPALAWFVYVSHGERSEIPGYMSWTPLGGFFERLIHPFVYSLTGWKVAILQTFDYAAIAGVGVALAMVASMAWRKDWNALAGAIYGCTVAVVFLKSRSVWEDAYAFGRVLAPFMLLTMLHELKARPWLALLPMAMVDARVGLNLTEQAAGILHGMTGI